MSHAAIFAPYRRKAVPVPPPTEDCWAFWDAPTIAGCTTCPQASVEANWPALVADLVDRGINTREVQAGVLGTLAVETAHTFEPVREAFWLDEAWRQANLRYYPYYGRGYIQLTWDYNYRAYGDALGCDLLNNPDMAMHPDIAAGVMAEYFVTRAVADSAQQCDWPEVRRKVQGGSAGLAELETVVRCLGLS